VKNFDDSFDKNRTDNNVKTLAADHIGQFKLFGRDLIAIIEDYIEFQFLHFFYFEFYVYVIFSEIFVFCTVELIRYSESVMIFSDYQAISNLWDFEGKLLG
jgi:hypothetical protein